MSETIAASPDGRYRLRLVQDNDAPNPRRDFDHLANVITPKGQNFIDVDADGGPLQYAWDYYSDGWSDDSLAVARFTRHARLHHGVTVVEDRPNGSAWSLWYVMPDKAAESTATPEEIIQSEQAEYQSWAEGDVYGYVIEKAVTWVPKEGHGPEEDEDIPAELETWEHVDSCWGYYGYDSAKESAEQEFADYLADTTPRRIDTAASVLDGLRTPTVSNDAGDPPATVEKTEE